MKQLTFRLVCFILLIIQLSLSNLAQTKPEDLKTEQIKSFALKLSESKTEVEQNALLDGGKDFLSPELTQFLVEQARTFFAQGNLPKTFTILHLAESLADKSGDKLNKARVLTTYGNIYRIQSKDTLALQYLEKALPLHEEMGNKLGISNTLFFMGNIHILLGNYAQALE